MSAVSVDEPLCQDLLRRLDKVLPKAVGQFVALHEPEFAGHESNYLMECLGSTFVSSVGKFVDEFESMLARYLGVKHAVVVANGTAALHVALHVAGVCRDDEVLVPALSFVATANAVVHCGAVPHFVDSSLQTLGLDPESIAEHLQRIGERTANGLRNRHSGRRIAAIVPMHTFGHPVDMNPLMEVARRHAITVIEDAAESLGSLYHGRHAGTFGEAGVLSFNGNKIITTGGGGAIITNDVEFARRAKHLTTTAKRAHRWEFFHDAVAWNYRMPNLNAALGCAQLERLDHFLARKRKLAADYESVFRDAPQMSFVVEPKGCASNYWLNTIRLTQPDFERRDELLRAANDAGYQCRPAWTLLHKLPMYEHNPRAPLPMAERLEASLISLPSSATLRKTNG